MEVTMNVRDLVTLCREVAGAATGPLLRDNPDYVFPSDEVIAATNRVIAEKIGIQL